MTIAGYVFGHKAAQAAERLAAGTVWEDWDLVCCRPDGRPIDPEEYAGLPREIEDEHGAMRAFYASLHRTAVGATVAQGVRHTLTGVGGRGPGRVEQRCDAAHAATSSQ